MTDADESDESLMRRYARGDASAFETLYRRHELPVWRYLERNVRNRSTADELMQEVWFAVARDAADYEPSARFTTWLFTIAHNRMLDSIRTSRRQSSLDSLGYEDESVVHHLTTDPRVGPLGSTLAREQSAALTQAIGQLPHDQRDALLLQIEGALSVEEIATITHSSFETTKSRLRYSRLKLRELLNEFA
jgi:RNA polymerase sigma-70 factor (ECF subfamily)